MTEDKLPVGMNKYVNLYVFGLVWHSGWIPGSTKHLIIIQVVRTSGSGEDRNNVKGCSVAASPLRGLQVNHQLILLTVWTFCPCILLLLTLICPKYEYVGECLKRTKITLDIFPIKLLRKAGLEHAMKQQPRNR